MSAALGTACTPASNPAQTVQGDSFIGAADAKVVMIEYGAPTCPSCKSWHDEVWRQLKADYIDTGRIKFIFRELPSHNPPVDASIFAIARCSGAEAYFDVIDEAFVQQQQIERASQSVDGPRKALTALAAKFGLDAKEFEACVKDPAMIDRILAVQAEAEARNVSGTPTFFINDKLIDRPSYANIRTGLDTALAGAGAP
ncbi:MAG: thioredoxin domain-containing protein [Alphaproteobacteria bacterium]|nr:thioredoxin domain-containing protein [Alphaproteobacteria bacterium]